jgi:glucose/arabinose dehydrogenase
VDGIRPPGGRGLRAALLTGGLTEPVDLTAPPGDTTRIFIVEKPGRIRIFKGGRLLPGSFLDITARTSRGSEQGLLGLAFHPQYHTNRAFYVYYTDLNGDSRLHEFLTSDNPDSASSTEREILFVGQPFPNHNGGQLTFGPDGYLYVGLGDGGSGGDPQGNGQNLGALLGKILRLEVTPGSAAPYSIPTDNPFRGRAGARPEIWDYGLRNPWRFSFDRLNGDLYIGDVGQDLWEEVDYEPARAGGRNYGWNVVEGTHCYGASTCDTTGKVLPVVEYGHHPECSVTGGYVYRGASIAEMNGVYFYGDYCSGLIRSFRIVGGRAIDPMDWTAAFRTQGGAAMSGLSSFGQDARGGLYIVLLGGEVYRIERAP